MRICYNNNMPNDVILLNALANELNDLLSDGRIEKIYQPEIDEVTFAVKARGKIHTLVISASPSAPRTHITAGKKENSLNPPAFCMLLRKYLSGANLKNVGIFNYDRIIKFTFETRSELKDRAVYYLLAELMGRYSNIILTDENYKIIDAIRRIHFDQSTTRYILPNLQYVLQPKNKASLDDEKALQAVFNSGVSEYSLLPKLISGIGKETAKEIFFAENPYLKLQSLVNIYRSDLYAPVLKTENGKPIDYYVYRYTTAEGEFVPKTTLNECLDEYYTLLDGNERKKASSKTVNAVLKRMKEKIDRRISDYTEKIAEKEKAEKWKQFGETILGNIWKIKTGDKFAEGTDYESGENIRIPLDENLSPSANAQIYFKKYSKAKKAAEIAEKQLEELYKQKEYLKSVELSVRDSETKQEYSEIIDELNRLNGKTGKQTNKKEKTSRPVRVKTEFGEIIYGRNNLQNNEVTFKIADRNDLWLHVKARHGSHVVIKGEITDETLLKAARMAAFYSECRYDEKVDVDYTSVKYVKKIPSSLPGLVTYTNYKTITVSPADENGHKAD